MVAEWYYQITVLRSNVDDNRSMRSRNLHIYRKNVFAAAEQINQHRIRGENFSTYDGQCIRHSRI